MSRGSFSASWRWQCVSRGKRSRRSPCAVAIDMVGLKMAAVLLALSLCLRFLPAGADDGKERNATVTHSASAPEAEELAWRAWAQRVEEGAKEPDGWWLKTCAGWSALMLCGAVFGAEIDEPTARAEDVGLLFGSATESVCRRPHPSLPTPNSQNIRTKPTGDTLGFESSSIDSHTNYKLIKSPTGGRLRAARRRHQVHLELHRDGPSR